MLLTHCLFALTLTYKLFKVLPLMSSTKETTLYQRHQWNNVATVTDVQVSWPNVTGHHATCCLNVLSLCSNSRVVKIPVFWGKDAEYTGVMALTFRRMSLPTFGLFQKLIRLPWWCWQQGLPQWQYLCTNARGVMAYELESSLPLWEPPPSRHYSFLAFCSLGTSLFIRKN